MRWCDREDVDNLNELTGRTINCYQTWRREDGDLSPASEKTQTDPLRIFVKWLESIDVVEQDLHVNVQSQNVTAEENIRHVMVESGEAAELLEYLA